MDIKYNENATTIEDYIINLKDEEIVAITPQEEDKIAKLLLAKDGVHLPQFPTEPKYATVPEPKILVYRIKLPDWTNIYLKDKAEADKLLDLCSNFKSFGYVSSDVFELRTSDVIELTKEYTYTKDQKKEIADLELVNKRLKDPYQFSITEYNKAKESYDEIIEHLDEAIFNAQQRINHKQSILNKFTEYVNLADGDVKIAINFLEKNIPISEAEALYIIGHTTISQTVTLAMFSCSNKETNNSEDHA